MHVHVLHRSTAPGRAPPPQRYRSAAVGPARPGFTMIELMVSMAVVIIVMTIVAASLSTLRRLTAATTAQSEAGQVARTLFDQIESDVRSLSRNGLLYMRKEESASPLSFSGMSTTRNLLVQKVEGSTQTIRLGRTDWLVIVGSGQFVSQSDADGGRFAGLTSNTARVIYAHSNRTMGNLRDDWTENPGYWSTNWTLVRQQTLLAPLMDLWDRNFDGQPDFPDGDGSGQRGRGFKPVRGDVANISLADLLSYHWTATYDGGINGRNDSQVFVTRFDFSDEKPEVALFRVKRDDLTEAQIRDRNPSDNEASINADGFYWMRRYTAGSNTRRLIEGYQRPRILPEAGPDGVVGTDDDGPSTMIGRVAAQRCPHFRVEWTMGETNELGELVWEDQRLNAPGGQAGEGYAAVDMTRRPIWNLYWHGSPPTARLQSRNVGDYGTGANSNDILQGVEWQRWPRAIRIQVIIVDGNGRDPIGFFYERIIALPDI